MSMNLSLDGFMSGPHAELDWHFQHWTDEMAFYLSQQLSRADTILLGSHTYKAMSKYWPYKLTDINFPREDLCFANMMNNYNKIVFSNNMQKADWQNSTMIRGDVKQKVVALKNQEGKDIIIYGSGTLVASLLPIGLIDEYQLWIHPIILGHGRPFFVEIDGQIELKLTEAKRFDSGVVLLQYQAFH